MATLVNYTCKSFIKLTPGSFDGEVKKMSFKVDVFEYGLHARRADNFPIFSI